MIYGLSLGLQVHLQAHNLTHIIQQLLQGPWGQVWQADQLVALPLIEVSHNLVVELSLLLSLETTPNGLQHLLQLCEVQER